MIINIENLTKYYHSSSTVTMALNKINLSFNKGEFVAITGESGSGKSTLLNVLSGFLPFEDGEMYIYGEPVSSFDKEDLERYRRDRISFVFQDYSLIDSYTVLDNVIAAMLLCGKSKDESRAKALEIIEQVGLKDFVNQKAYRLSSGQKQRLSIARALAKDTDIIMADEPTGNLDNENGKQIIELFAKLAKDKLVIMVTHNYEQAKDYVSRTIRMYNGEVVADTGAGQINDSEVIKSVPLEAKACKAANYFVCKNITRRPLREAFLCAFILICMMADFIFLGQIYSNFDSTLNKDSNGTIFTNEDNCRLIVRREDGKILSDDDLKNIEDTYHIDYVEKYDAVSDINYAYDSEDILYDTISNLTYFMKSVSCLEEGDVLSGKLPQKRDEIAVSKNSELSVGDRITYNFVANKAWSRANYLMVMTVTALVDYDGEQTFFSEALCDMFSKTVSEPEVSIKGSFCKLDSTYHFDYLFTPIIDDKLGNGECSFSGEYLRPNLNHNGPAHMLCEGLNEVIFGDFEKLVIEEDNSAPAKFIGVSEDFYYTCYEKGSRQCGAYITDFAYTDRVIKRLEKNGYEAISVARAANTVENIKKSDNRQMILIVSFSMLIAVMIMEIVIIATIMRLRKKDISIITRLGGTVEIIGKIVFKELNLISVVAMLIGVGLSFILASRVSMFSNIFVWLEWWKILIIIAYALITIQISILVVKLIYGKNIISKR